MLDRLISGAGAVTDGADRSVRLLAGGSRRGVATTRPGSVAVAALLVVLAALLVLAGLEATDPRTPLAIAPADVAHARDLGIRTYATVGGSVDSTYVETYADGNGNGIEDQGETGVAWYYWLVDRADRAGITVRSTRPPAQIYTFTGSGVVIADPHDPAEDRTQLDNELRTTGVQVDPTEVIDATNAVVVTGGPLDLAAPLPASGTGVGVSGPRIGSWVGVCHEDTNHNGACDLLERDRFEIVVFDPVSKHAVRVLVRDLPEFTDATMTGLLRREERAVDDARTTEGLEYGELGLAISDRYILDDGAEPGSAPLAFALAAGLVAMAGIILLGLAGGYLIYRKGDGRLPTPATTLAPGERVPLRITGLVRTPTGLEHVREAPGELVRFALRRPVTDVAGPVATTLLVERTGHPQGVALGLGELDRLSSGRVMALRGPRPAVRAVAGTGPLFLSFDTEAERDRAAAELLDETGLGPDGKHIVTP